MMIHKVLKKQEIKREERFKTKDKRLSLTLAIYGGSSKINSIVISKSPAYRSSFSQLRILSRLALLNGTFFYSDGSSLQFHSPVLIISQSKNASFKTMDSVESPDLCPPLINSLPRSYTEALTQS